MCPSASIAFRFIATPPSDNGAAAATQDRDALDSAKCRRPRPATIGARRAASASGGGEDFERRRMRAHAAGRIERKDANVVGAGAAMLLETRANFCLIAPGDDRVDEPIAAAAGDVAVIEAQV